jgi:hypothetical protein
MQLAAKIRDVHAGLSRRRVERQARRTLSAELATFTSAADRAELDHLLDRHSSEETREIRAILVRQDAVRG